MENDLLLKYDAICYKTYYNIQYLTKDAKRIVLKGVDWKNLEHRFVVHIVNACYSILGEREVAMDAGPFTRSTISHECKSLGKIRKMREDEIVFVDVPDLIEFMRDFACEECGVEFTFSDIYRAYYCGKDKR